MRTVAAVLAALLLVGCRPAVPTSPGNGSEAPAPAAPQGTRWAGVGDLVVAVPRDWETVSGVCVSPGDHEMAVQADGAAAVRCALTRRGAPSLVLSPPGSLGWSPGRGVRCESAPTGPCSARVGTTDDGFRISYRGPHAERELRALLASLTAPPEGWTTVPAIDYGVSDRVGVEVLADAGLVGVPPDVDWPHYVVGTEPAVGSVVAEGSEVALLPGDG